MGVSKRPVRRLVAVEAHHRRAARREPRIGEGEHRGGRAIVGDEIDLPECLPRPFAESVEQVARGREGAGDGALESEDRLLAVAGGEQRADALSIAGRTPENHRGPRRTDATWGTNGNIRQGE